MSSSSSCHFCTRANPAGSKFCNHCGEPLDLKPCKHCEAFNHVAVDRCYQCGALFVPAKQEAVAAAVTGAPSAGESPATPSPRGPVSKPVRVEPALDPLEHTPVALSDRMEAYTERVAEHVGDAPPFMPFAATGSEAETDDEVDRLDARRQREARLESRSRRRTRAAVAAVATVVLCAIAGGSYVAYDAGWLSRAGAWAHAAEQRLVASSSSIIGKLGGNIGQAREPTPDAAPNKPAATDSAAPTPTPAPAQPAADAPAPLVTKTLDDAPPASSGSAAPSSSPQGAATDTAPPASRTASPSARKATRPARPGDAARRAARETPAKPPHAAPTPAPVDKDALATQRLIQRDLAGFLPPDASSPPR